MAEAMPFRACGYHRAQISIRKKPDLRENVTMLGKPLVRIVVALVLVIGVGPFLLDSGGVFGYALFGALVGVGIWLVRPIFTGEMSLRTPSAGQRDRFSAEAVAPAGQALLYVYRPGPLGLSYGYTVELDGQLVGELKSQRYLRLAIAPGEHALQVAAKGFAARTLGPGIASFVVAAGETAVFALGNEATGMAKAKITVVREHDVAAVMTRMAAMKQGTSI